MKCEKCGKQEANLYYQETVNGQTRAMHICSACARELQMYTPFQQTVAGFSNSFGEILGVPSLFGSMASPLFAGGAEVEAKNNRADTAHTCPSCGMTLSELQRKGRVGCPDCYHTFAEVLTPYIKRVQGAESHIGSAPQQEECLPPEAHPLDALKQKLQEAIQSENYEEAARLRDEIRRKEEK